MFSFRTWFLHTIEKAPNYIFPFAIDQCPIYIQPASILAEFLKGCTYKLDYYDRDKLLFYLCNKYQYHMKITRTCLRIFQAISILVILLNLHRTLISAASSLLSPMLFSARQTYVPLSFLWTGSNSSDSTNLRSSVDPSFLQNTLAGGLASAPHFKVALALPSSNVSSAYLVMLTFGLSKEKRF